MPDAINNEVCHKLRAEIYSAIFPRWALISIGGVFVMVLMVLYGVTAGNGRSANNAMRKAELIEATFTEKVLTLEKGQLRIEIQLAAQNTILMDIKDSLPRTASNMRGNDGN